MTYSLLAAAILVIGIIVWKKNRPTQVGGNDSKPTFPPQN